MNPTSRLMSLAWKTSLISPKKVVPWKAHYQHPPPIGHSATSPEHSTTTREKIEVQALNKNLRGEAPEETRKMLPDSQATLDSKQSRAFASLKTSLSSNTKVLVSQKRPELTSTEKTLPNQRPDTAPLSYLKPIPEISEQATSKPEQSTEITDVTAFRNKQSFFEGQIAAQQSEIKTRPPIAFKPSHSSIHDYQPGKVSKENEWMKNPHHNSQHSPAPWEQELKNIRETANKSFFPKTVSVMPSVTEGDGGLIRTFLSRNPSASADLNTPQQYQEAAATKHQQKAPPPPPPERKS